MSDPNLDGILLLLHRVEALKHLPRSGWVERRVQEPESVAAHSWRLAFLAWIAAPFAGMDGDRAMRLAIVHDLAEALVGDKTPFDGLGLSEEDRYRLSITPDSSLVRREAWQQRKVEEERAALELLLQDAPAAVATQIRDAWEEYEQGTSAEARFVKQLDKFEAYLQGREYAHDGRIAEPATLNSFRADNERLLTDPILRRLLAALQAEEAQPRT